jgi:hypothetical protein
MNSLDILLDDSVGFDPVEVLMQLDMSGISDMEETQDVGQE